MNEGILDLRFAIAVSALRSRAQQVATALRYEPIKERQLVATLTTTCGFLQIQTCA
jgi:hypothetical protein